MTRYYSSTAVETTLVGSLSSSGTTMQVASNSGWPVTFPFAVILEKGTANEEIVDVTAYSAPNYTIVRGVDGTTGKAHNSGAKAEHGISARDLRESREHEDDTSAHGVTGDLVGTTDTQTLTGKTMSGASNTFTNIPQSAVSGLVAALAAAISATLINAKGDLIVGSADDAATRLAVGPDNQVLTADAAAPTGVKWAALPTQAVRWVAGATCSNEATKNIDFAFVAGRRYRIVWQMEGVAGAAGLNVRMRASGTTDSGNNYGWGGASGTSIQVGAFNTDGGEGWFEMTYAGDARRTLLIGTYITGAGDGSTGGSLGGVHKVSSAQSGIHFLGVTYNMTGRIDIYEYAQAA